MEEKWNNYAQTILKREIRKRKATYEDICDLLKDIGVSEKPESLAKKIYRGAFSFANFLQIMYVLDVHSIRLEELYDDNSQSLSPHEKAE